MRALILTLPLFLLLACRKDTPEAAVRKAFQSCVEAVEAGNPGDVVEQVHPQFRGPEGINRAQARFLLAQHFRSGKIGITTLSETLEVRGKRATHLVEVLLTSRTGLFPNDGARRSYRLIWELEDGDWMLRELKEL